MCIFVSKTAYKDSHREMGESGAYSLENTLDRDTICHGFSEPKTLWNVQSDEVVPDSVPLKTTTAQNVRFVDAEMGMKAGIDRSHDGVSAADQTEYMDMVKFLSRPVRIANFTWNEADAVGTSHTYNPWNLFFTDARVRYKLNNFGFIQCKLKVKVLINASPFYYGLMYMGYQPLPTLTPSTIQNDTGTRYFIPYSQRPHIWIKPQGNEAGEMTLPFFYHQNFIDAQSAQAMTDMGQLTFLNYTALQSANGVSSSGVSIAIYAWAEDVKLSGPSVGLATQSDEYGNGPISGPATAISNGASWFENIPIIGRFATATRIGASAVSSVAKLFGFTNVPVIADTAPFRNQPVPMLASTDIGYPIEKLTLDPKNELTIDPSILGLESTDELVISHLAQRESYLTTTTWSTASSVDDILFSSRVMPSLYDNDNATNNKLYLTPMAWTAAPFLNWRGDIIFKFKIIASQFHKGRLRISYDPSGQSGENILVDPVSANVVFTSIVDLCEDNEVEFRVPYQQATSFLQNPSGWTYSQIPWSTSLTPTYARNPVYDNGYITLRVQTALTAPVASSSVSVIVTVRAAENIEFANPRELPRATTWAVQGDYTESDSAVSFLTGTGEPNLHQDRYLINFGESIKSFRQLFRRSSLAFVTTMAANGGTSVLYKRTFTKMPPMFGYDTSTGIHRAKGLVATATTFQFNYTQTLPVQWILPAFVSYRGSTHYTFNCFAPGALGSVRTYRINNVVTPTADETITSNVSGTRSADAAFYLTNLAAGSSGQAVTNGLTNTGMNISCPNYSQFRMQSTSPGNWTRPTSVDGSRYDVYGLELDLDGSIAGAVPGNVKMYTYHSIGNDFNCHFFLNVPTFWNYGLPVPV